MSSAKTVYETYDLHRSWVNDEGQRVLLPRDNRVLLIDREVPGEWAYAVVEDGVIVELLGVNDVVLVPKPKVGSPLRESDLPKDDCPF